REKVCIGVLTREALALAGVEIPIPGRGGRVGHGHRADGAIAEFEDECTRVFPDPPPDRIRHHGLHALDLTEQVAQQIDVVDRVHEDWSTAGLPAPFDIEILVWLAPGAKHRRRHGSPELARIDDLLRVTRDRIVTTMMADQRRDVFAS